ncbi:MAG: helix-turn-helix domain-containing protein [Oscillospiraceae bacterium]|nr:helix-turn-helix domain-containing protein [Oscillospiraceae bacterium]
MDDHSMMRDRQKIISMLTAARIEKGLSQQALADLIGTKRSNICRMESGAQNISLDMLLKVARALGKDVSVTLEEKAQPERDRYSLRLYDEELLTFSLRSGGLEGLQAKILTVNEDRKSVFPLGLTVSDEGVMKWLERRVIPKNRAFVDEILKSLGLSINNTKGIIDVCKGLSLNDSFWVVPVGFSGTFAQYNLYENRFSSVLSLVAYTGVGQSHEAFTTSPELTTQGMLRKAWRFIEDDGIYLYKGGTEGAANAGREPYSEYYACQIAERMGLHAVHYDLENWKDILASKCRLFTDIDTAYIPIGHLVKSGGIKACLDYYAAISEEALDELKSMLVFDAVIYNEDRHFGNFGILRENRTGRVLGAAPIFDNGISLFNYAMPDDYVHLDEYAKTRANPYGISYEDVCREVMGTKQRSQLRKLIGFQFRRHPSINLPEEHLQAIEKQISVRVRELLALPRV